MTQAIVASYYCCGRGHGGHRGSPRSSHHQSEDTPLSPWKRPKNEDLNLFRSEKLHPAVQQCFNTVDSLSFYAVTRWWFPPFEDIFNPKLVEMIPKLTWYHLFLVGLATQPPTLAAYHGLPPQNPWPSPRIGVPFERPSKPLRWKMHQGSVPLVSWLEGDPIGALISWFMNVYPYTTMGSKNLAVYIPNISEYPIPFSKHFLSRWFSRSKGWDNYNYPPWKLTWLLLENHLILSRGDTSSKDCFQPVIR